MITVEDVEKAVKEGIDILESEGGVARTLSKYEMDVIARTLNTHLNVTFPQRREVIEDIFKRHLTEICIGAMFAKEQMEAEVDGMLPESSKIGGPIPIRACWLGVGKDWVDAAPFSTGEPVYWIHSGTSLLGGTPGRPIRIGRNAVHVILAIGNYNPSPKLESVKFELNGSEKPLIELEWMNIGGLTLVELDKAIILRRGSTVLGTVYASDSYGSEVDDIPYTFGVSFILEDKLRIQDATQIPGTVHDVVTTT